MSLSDTPTHPPGDDDPRIADAAQWLVDEASPPHPVLPAIRQRFRLDTASAIAAIRAANAIRRARS